ncbi:acetyltransferase [Thiohalocapsa marina]|uniref:Acetyltransferase n=1 Tax=Thiohalocapsa marina TaxID=424902 RepID=A0A5M8FLI3_9GAMM|nr:acetyltransferase [Thiohalocapsa marina]KAA6183315.1 acetyltransferase [Thiohalocapsa marina]
MARFDVFNGDADGLCALQQLRLEQPGESVLITGVKRDIALLERVAARSGDEVTVLDISLDKNRPALLRLLDAGVRVRWFDHHFPGDIPEHPAFEVHVETLPDKGTCLLVDDYLHGARRAWAVVGTFGDNFDAAARRAAEPLGLSAEDLDLLRELGILLNYNGYGATVADLHVPPDALFRRLAPYADPLAFVREDPCFDLLRRGYAEDMEQARRVPPLLQTDRHAVLVLPAEPWARRVSGVHANALAQAAPGRAHALLTRLPEGGFVISVRAPLAAPDGADALCRQFATGGGRKAAAGINQLPETDLERFIDAFQEAF